MLYLVLLIPFGESRYVPPAGEPSQRTAFAWNQDEYWSALEETYRTLKQGGCETAVPALASKFRNMQGMLDRVNRNGPGPQDSIFRQLEGLVFEIGPVVSACNTRVVDYIELIADMRTIIKKQSVDWDMNATAARTTLYRLLYGSRAAAEEVMLQSPAGTLSTDRPGKK